MTDGLDLTAVTIRNSPDVKDWAVTAKLTKLEFRSSGVHVEHSKNVGEGAWPNFRPPGWDGDLQYTLWIFLQIAGKWYGSGCIQFWQSCDQNGGPPEEFAKNWYYAADRWAPMTGHQPGPSERVGFMVSAGDARNSGIESVRERSNIVVMPFPSSGGVYLAPAEPSQPDPPPSPGPETPPTPPATPPAPTDLMALLNTMRDEVILNKLQNADLVAKVDGLNAKVDGLSDTLRNTPALTPPDYSGTLNFGSLIRSQSVDILLKPKARQ